MAQSKILYSIGKVILLPAYKLLYRYKNIGSDNVPEEGGVLLASNHLTFADPVLLGLCLKRRLYFMAKAELFSNKFASFFIRHLGAFPVDRGAGDGKAIKTGEDIIKEGNMMTIFIEGGRSKTGELMRPRSGCALVSQQMQVPVVPACITIVGNPKHRFSKRVIHFGKPLSPENLGLTPDGGRRELKNASNMIMNEIKKMREEDLENYKKG